MISNNEIIRCLLQSFATYDAAIRYANSIAFMQGKDALQYKCVAEMLSNMKYQTSVSKCSTSDIE